LTTHVLSPDRPFAHRLALARAGATSYARRAAVNAAAVGLAQTAALAGALLIAGWMRATVLGEAAGVQGAGWLVLPLHILAATLARLLPGWGLGAVEELRRTILVVIGVFASVALMVWLAGPASPILGDSSRLTLVLAGGLALLFVPLARTAAKRLLVERDAWGVPIAVYGAGRAGALVVRRLQEEPGMGYTPIAVFDDDRRRWGEYLDTVPIVGGTDRVLGACGAAVLAMPDSPAEYRLELLEGPLSCYRTVVVVPDLVDAPSLWVRPRDMAGLLALEITSNLTRPLPRVAKRALDLVITVAAAPLWAPAVLALAVLLWVRDGASPWFTQERVGVAGRPFRLYKLRTMYPDADRVLDEALAADASLRAEWAATFKLARDPRATPVGRLVRALSLDELPQLVNVLRGEMSLVGPRPLPRYHHEEIAESVREIRERVRPGVTGLWQVSGRGDAGTAGMERWDPYYVRNWSLWLDAVILVRTVRAVLARRGAY
jgi:Undecaprenyl-phosphate galactose phosphotransferase WbaP